MYIGTALLAFLAAAAHGADGFAPPSNFATRSSAVSSLAMSTKEKEATKAEKKNEDAPPVHIGWDSHEAVVRFDLVSTRWKRDASSDL